MTSAGLRRKILPHVFLAAEEKVMVANGDHEARLLDWRQQGLRIGLTNGRFDILHPGHVKVLTAARAACDRLIVGFNSDTSVKRLKGEGRPLQNESARSEVLPAVEAVDTVAVFEDDTPIKLIAQIQPSALVKGDDYTRGQVVDHKIVAALGVQIMLVDALAGFSTTSLVNRARGQVLTLITGKLTMIPFARRLREPAAWVEMADLFAILTAISLPWSTSLVAIFATALLLSMVPSLDVKAFLQSLQRPVCVAPIALFALALIGILWSDAEWSVRLHAVAPTVKLLVMPVLLFHFERSQRGLWVFVAFLASCAFLMVISWAVVFHPALSLKPAPDVSRGIFVKNYIDQSQEFTLCAVGLAFPIITSLRSRRFLAAAFLIALCAGFFINMAFVVVSRTAIVTVPVMLAVFGWLHLKWRANLVIFCLAIAFALVAWAASPSLQSKITSFTSEYQLYKEEGASTSIGQRLEFWRKSLVFFADAPVIGHGTGSTRKLFEQSATGPANLAAAEVIGNPHNQTLNVAVQWGAMGIAVLYAMWLLHLSMFRGEGLANWIGLLVVVQNIFTSLFNSHIFDFHEGWMYVLGLGVAGGMLKAAPARSESRLAVSPKMVVSAGQRAPDEVVDIAHLSVIE